ncbi:MAG: EAL domain-containing protein, partial [Pseudomonadota bacterium]
TLASVGVASAPAAQAAALLSDADVALYEAKNQGRGRVVALASGGRQAGAAERSIGEQLLEALERDAFVPAFQPQFDARTGACVGVEAFARWLRPDGAAPPAAFLEAAESLELLAEIDRRIFAASVAQCLALRARGAPAPTLSVNVSRARLVSDGFAADVRAAVAEGLPLVFEVSEAFGVDAARDDETVFAIERIRALGAVCAVDGYGAGPVSAVGLLKIRPDRLKIDRRLTAAVADCSVRRALAGSVVAAGRALGAGVGAAGVETLAQARALRDLGCDVLQGFAFAPPVAGSDLERTLRARDWPRIDAPPAAAGGG